MTLSNVDADIATAVVVRYRHTTRANENHIARFESRKYRGGGALELDEIGGIHSIELLVHDPEPLMGDWHATTLVDRGLEVCDRHLVFELQRQWLTIGKTKYMQLDLGYYV